MTICYSFASERSTTSTSKTTSIPKWASFEHTSKRWSKRIRKWRERQARRPPVWLKTLRTKIS